MREFLEVFKYTFKENIKKKAFIISTVIILLIINAAIIIPGLLMTSKSDNADKKENKSIIYVIDKSGYFEKNIETIQKDFEKYSVKSDTEANIDKIKNEIKEKGKNVLVKVDKTNGVPSFQYIVKQYGDGPNTDDITVSFKKIYTAGLLNEANVSKDISDKIMGDIKLDVKELGKNKWGGFIASITITILLFFAIYFYGYGVAMSVASEKTSRVMELLVTSVKPSRIILGKCFAMGLVGLTQLGLIVINILIYFLLVLPTQIALGNINIDFSSLTPFVFLMMIVYFVLGYFLYAMMNAVVGATVSKAEDVNSSMMPMTLITIIAFYFAYGTFAVPDSAAARAASLIPFSAAFSMPARLVSTNIPAWEIIASLLILIVTIAAVSILSIKMYSFAILHYGNRMSIGKLFKLAKNV